MPTVSQGTCPNLYMFPTAVRNLEVAIRVFLTLALNYLHPMHDPSNALGGDS